MPRTSKRDAKLETATARSKLQPRRKPYYTRLGVGIHLGYRRNAGGIGTWSVRVAEGGTEWVKRIAFADDVEKAAPPEVLTYWQAIEAARKLARRQPGATVEDGRPLTVAEALVKYADDLKRRGGGASNARRAQVHVGALASKPVALLSAADLTRWRDGLLVAGKLAPASVNRTASCLRAALELAAAADPRITNVRAFKIGLAVIADAQRARNVVLADEVVRRLVAAAHRHDRKLGLLVETLAISGARPGQVVRLEVGDLHADPARPKLMMPRSGKGGSRNRAARKAERYSVEVTGTLAAALKQEAAGRPSNAPLLTRANGAAWGDNPHAQYRRDFRAVVASIGLDPAEIVPYALRHSFVVRLLLANVPVRVIASKLDTSIAMIEKNYSRFISEHSDEITRRVLLEIGPDTADAAENVIPLVR